MPAKYYKIEEQSATIRSSVNLVVMSGIGVALSGYLYEGRGLYLSI